jgi:hypothetical protein
VLNQGTKVWGKAESMGEIRNAFIILVENLKIRGILEDIATNWGPKLKYFKASYEGIE